MSNKGRTKKRDQAKATRKGPQRPASQPAADDKWWAVAAAMGDVVSVRTIWGRAEEALTHLATVREEILVNAALHGHTDVARVLIDAGVDLGAVVASDGSTLVEVAELFGHTETARVIQDAINATEALRDLARLRRVVGAGSMEQRAIPIRRIM